MMAPLACATGWCWLPPAAHRSCRPVSHRTSRDTPARIFGRQPLPSPSNLLLLPLWSPHRQRGDRGDRRQWRLARRQCFRSRDRIHARFCFAAAIHVLCVPSLPLRAHAICSLAACAHNRQYVTLIGVIVLDWVAELTSPSVGDCLL